MKEPIVTMTYRYRPWGKPSVEVYCAGPKRWVELMFWRYVAKVKGSVKHG